jgi:toxin CptA
LSTASSSCRIDWRPSPLLCLALLALGSLAGASMLISELPVAWAWPLALLAVGQGARLAWSEWRRPPCAIEVDGAGVASIEGSPLASTRLRLRGSLASLAWRDATGRRGTLAWCADTLPAPARRQLLLRLGGQSRA